MEYEVYPRQNKYNSTWELKSGFNPMNVKAREQPAWNTLKGEIPLPTTHLP